MLVPPRWVKYMDAVSNGLDASTTFDIFRSMKLVVSQLHVTGVVSLLQVPTANSELPHTTNSEFVE